MEQKDLLKLQETAVEVSEVAATNEILLHMRDKNRWVAYNWSGFLVRMLLAHDSCRCSICEDDMICVEIDNNGLYLLTTYADIIDNGEKQMRFQTAPVVNKFRWVYAHWKDELMNKNSLTWKNEI